MSENVQEADLEDTTIEVKTAPGEKCERCWNYHSSVGKDPNYPTICSRCSGVLKAQ